MVKQFQRRNAPKDIMKNAELVLDQDVLTIAFARRFATYKRANLLLNDPDRFEAIISSKSNPVQFVFAGKAHPRDHEGKELIKRLIHFARKTNIRHRMIFLEDYDIYIARHLVQGADVWLNNPRRPFEACGTSGMKAAINGVLNVSILDGWWCEGYAEDRGWSIGSGEEYLDSVYQDTVESRALYNLLEDEVIPRFYDRKSGDVPIRWVKMMKESMKMGMRIFCSHRMVAEYNERFYIPATNRLNDLLTNDVKEGKELALKHEKFKTLWKGVKIHHPELQIKGPFKVGDTFKATSLVNLGEIRPDDVEVELYFGVLKSLETLHQGKAKQMQMLEAHGNGQYLYSCDIKCSISGRYGFTTRVIPRGDYKTRFEPGLITWA